MTLTEFKAWFDGFSEAISDIPTKQQWDRIKTRVAEIDGSPVTERVFIDRYLPLYPYYRGYLYGPQPPAIPWWNTCEITGGTAGISTSLGYSSFDAMHELGRIESINSSLDAARQCNGSAR